MDLFTRVNAVYSSFFGSGPPSRACVAADLPEPYRISLECIAYAENSSSDRQALHVQGLSYWAPANIGPYSQAVTIQDQRIFISGQIGLISSTLSLPEPQSLALEASLACQHVERVIRALQSNSGGGWEGHFQLALYWMTRYNDLKHVKPAVDNLVCPILWYIQPFSLIFIFRMLMLQNCFLECPPYLKALSSRNKLSSILADL